MKNRIAYPIDPRGLLEMERQFSRRGFFGLLAKGLTMATAIETLGPRLKAAIRTKRPDTAHALQVYSAIGNRTIPIDQDPGWATYDPAISKYGFNTYVYQIFLANNNIAFDAYQDTLIFLDAVPAVLGGNANFLAMGPVEQDQYITDILSGNYDADGWQDILNLALNASIVSAKTTFYSNFPNHLAVAGSEFQSFPTNVRTGFVQMGLKGPVGPVEEAALRAKFSGIQELPGVDTSNPYI